MKRGFVLILCLSLLCLFFVVALLILGLNQANYAQVNSQVQGEQAYQLAVAGVEAVRLRLDHDQDFPPNLRASAQPTFQFSEVVWNRDQSRAVGSYLITLDNRWKGTPYLVLRCRSVGLLGPSERPLAQREIQVEFDLSPELRNSPTQVPNPRYFQWMEWLDLGGY